MKVVVTGCSTGLGLLTARTLLDGGHTVIPHVRNAAGADALRSVLPGASPALTADLTRQDEVVRLAAEIGDEGNVDAIIHNAGLGDRLPARTVTDGRADLFAVNVVAPYIVTALNPGTPRWVFISSALHRDATIRLDDPSWEMRDWMPREAYAESKLLLTVLAQATARLRPSTSSNSVEPGWVPTRMGGPQAPDDLAEGAASQAWLATAPTDPGRSGGHYYHRALAALSPYAVDTRVQDEVLMYLRASTGVEFDARRSSI